MTTGTRAPSTIVTINLTGQTDFTIPFEYLARKFVVVTLLGIDRKVLTLNTDYRFVSKTVISLANPTPAGYSQLELRRVTSATERLVDFHDGSILRAYDLNLSQFQTLHVAEEARDLTADTIGVNDDGNLDARGRRIVSLADGINPTDAATVAQLDALSLQYEDPTLTVWNRDVVTLRDGVRFAAYEQYGKQLVPRLLFRGRHYAHSGVTTLSGFIINGAPAIQADGSLVVETDQGPKKFSISDAEAVSRSEVHGAVPDIATLRSTEPSDGRKRVAVIGYYADTPLSGGGDFVYDENDTTSPDDSVLTFVTPLGARWKRQRANELGYLSALAGGARADCAVNLVEMKDFRTGSDNSDAQANLDAAARKLGADVMWPRGNYRFTRPLEQASRHVGTYRYGSEGTVFVLDNDTKTTWLKHMPNHSYRQQDLTGVWYVSAQEQVHTLLDGGFYRGSIEHCRISRFDIGLDVSAVYLWCKNVYFDNNNKGVYPRALHSNNMASTMFGFEECVFFMNKDIGFHHEVRPFGENNAAKELLNVQFIRCGMEYNKRGVEMSGRVWYVGFLNCWTEGNTEIGIRITNSFTDVYQLGCRWDDKTSPVFPAGRHMSWGPDGLMVDGVRTTRFRSTYGVKELKDSSVIVKADGTIVNPSGLPIKEAAVAADGTLTIQFEGEMTHPHVSATPVLRNKYLTCAITFDNTTSAGAVDGSNRITLIRLRAYEVSALSTIVAPAYWNISVGWPSDANM
ncbi:MAG: phage tail fiber protein [Aeromonas sp.]